MFWLVELFPTFHPPNAREHNIYCIMLVLLHCYCATANVTLLLFLHNHILNDYLLLYVMYTFIPIFFSPQKWVVRLILPFSCMTEQHRECLLNLESSLEWDHCAFSIDHTPQHTAARLEQQQELKKTARVTQWEWGCCVSLHPPHTATEMAKIYETVKSCLYKV